MASTATTKPIKLGEFLSEQQDPFVLEAYLIERGKSLNASNSINSSKILKRSYSWGQKSQSKSKKGTPSFSKLLRSVYRKFVPKNGGAKTKSPEKEEGKFDAADNQITRPSANSLEDSDGFSCSSSRTQYESCIDSDKDEAAAATVSLQNEDQVLLAFEGTSQVSNVCNVEVERKIPLINGESSNKKKHHSKDHTSIPVLIDRPSHAEPNMIMDESTLPSSLWELLFQPPLEKPKDTSGLPEMLEPFIISKSNCSSHGSKRMLQQTRQLLFDCVREMAEAHAKQMRDQNRTRLLGAEELGKMMSEKLRIWDRQEGDESNIDFLLDSDFVEWKCEEQEVKAICCEIGDAIFEEIVEEIVHL